MKIKFKKKQPRQKTENQTYNKSIKTKPNIGLDLFL